MKTRGCILLPREYRTPVAPPNALEDTSRFENNGVFTDVVWQQRPSELWVMIFNGATSIVDCGNDPSLRPYDAVSIEAWIYNPNYALGGANYQCVCTRGDWYAFINPDGRVYWYQLGTPNTAVQSNILNNGQTYHIACTFGDGSNQIKVYLNGEFNNQAARLDTNKLLRSSSSFYIGRSAPGGPYKWTGYIKARVRNYALSAPQIYAIYQAERRFFNV